MDINQLVKQFAVTIFLLYLSINSVFAEDIVDAEIIPFSADSTAVAADVNSNFSALKNGINTKQDKITALDCGDGFAIRKINSDGSTVCEKVVTTITGTGSGGVAGVVALPQTGIISEVDATNVVTLSIDNALIDQKAVAAVKAADGPGSNLNADLLDGKTSTEFVGSNQNCLSGQAVTSVDINGGVVCDPVVTSVVPGTGILQSSPSSGGGTMLAIDPFTVQSRVPVPCDPGWSIRGINQDGSVTCEFDDDNGINSVTAGAFLSGGGTINDPTLDVVGMPGISITQGSPVAASHTLSVNAPTDGFIFVSTVGDSGTACGGSYDGWGTMSLKLTHDQSGVASPKFYFSTTSAANYILNYSAAYSFQVAAGINTVTLSLVDAGGIQRCPTFKMITGSIMFFPQRLN